MDATRYCLSLSRRRKRKLAGEISDRFQVTAGKLQNAVRLHQRHSGENVVCDVAGAINDHVWYNLTEPADEFLRLLLGAGRIGVLVFMGKGAIQIASQFNLNENASDVITGIILFFILGSEFFIFG